MLPSITLLQKLANDLPTADTILSDPLSTFRSKILPASAKSS